MSYRLRHRKYRFLLLRISSVNLASVLLGALALVMAGFWLAYDRHAWLILLTVLLAIVSVAVLLRQGPVMWRDLTRYRRLQRMRRIQSLHNHVGWRFNMAPAGLIAQAWQQLEAQHYAVRQFDQDGVTLLCAVKGRMNRLGVLLAHLALLLILAGALLDSDLFLQHQLRTGQLHGASATIALNDLPSESRITARSTMAFQGYEDLHTGQISDEIRLETEQGVLAKHLPYAVAVQAVELDNRHALQADNFLTRISILDPKLDAPVQAVLGSNRPFHYRGLDFYQAAVTDGGSVLTVSMWPLSYARSIPLRFNTLVGTERQLETRQGTINIVFADLKPRNIMLLKSGDSTRAEYKNIGPSLFYTVNDASGVERQFVNYLLPVVQEGRYFFISGYRPPADSVFKYLHIPVDRGGNMDRFIELHAALFDEPRLASAINKVLADAGKTEASRERDEFKNTLTDLITLFRQGGFEAVTENISARVERQHTQQSLQLSFKLVRSVVYALYKENLGKVPPDEFDLLFFEDALPVLGRLAQAEMPFYIQLQDMQFKPVVKLLVSYKPGSFLFLGGWVVLLSGLALSFLTYHRRVWLVFDHQGDYTAVTVAGMAHRHRQQFTREFNRLFTRLQSGFVTC